MNCFGVLMVLIYSRISDGSSLLKHVKHENWHLFNCNYKFGVFILSSNTECDCCRLHVLQGCCPKENLFLFVERKRHRKYQVVKVSLGGLYGALMLGSIERLCVPTTCECKFNFSFNPLVFESPHYLTLSAPLKLHSFSTKTTIHRFMSPPKILWQKAKSNH